MAPTSSDQLLRFFEDLGGALLWRAPASNGSGHVIEVWSVRNSLILVMRFHGGAWDVFVPAHNGARIDNTLLALRRHLDLDR